MEPPALVTQRPDQPTSPSQPPVDLSLSTAVCQGHEVSRWRWANRRRAGRQELARLAAADLVEAGASDQEVAG
jgi:hypothetical protein